MGWNTNREFTGCDNFKALGDAITMLYLKFWKTISKVTDTKDTIKFKLNSLEIVYTVDMFRDTLHPPMETLNNPFITPVNIKVIKSLMQKISYQDVIDKKKDAIRYPRFTKLIIDDLMKFPSIPQRLDENYHSIKDDIPLVNVYSTGNVLFRGMLILNAFLTDEIRATDDYKETTPSSHRSPTLTTTSPQKKKRKQVAGETSSPRKSLKVTIKQNKPSTTPILPHSDDRERGEIAKATLLSLTLHETALAAEAQDNIAKVQEKLVEEKIEKMVKGEEDVISYASEFVICLMMMMIPIGSMKTRKEKIQTPIPSPTRSPRRNLSSDKTLSQELTEIVSPYTATTSKICEFLDHCNNVVPELTFAKKNEKDSWHKRRYKLNQRRVRDNPEEYFSDHRITEVVRVTTDQQHGLDYMEQIIVIRENDKPDSFSEAEFKYLNKNGIEDLYYLCLNKKVNFRKIKLMNSLITFIRSCII
ncbi:hypothetical protein Tco_1556423 [Tanacetum coccineum]